MNNRFQVLAEKSGLYYSLAAKALYPSALTAEECEHTYREFAESIVQNCISLVEGIKPGYQDYRNQIEDAFRRDCIAEIKNYFGLEQ